MKYFFSCDWGTTAFRLRLVETESLKIVDEETSQQGIAETFQTWKQNGSDIKNRIHFYLNIISQHIAAIAKRTGISLQEIPVIISGMASSSIGMIDLPYKTLPVATSGVGLVIHLIDADDNFSHEVIIISGLRTDDDVMRGEETKLIGSASTISGPDNHVYIFPGTHCKHVEVKNGEVKNFKTFMTGEFFALLSEKSILSVSVQKGDGLLTENAVGFERGVRDSVHSNILHSSFSVRTNQLFNKMSPAENYQYLSGLLIGSELTNLLTNPGHITVVGSKALSAQYLTALRILNLPPQGFLLTFQDADESLVKGQQIVYKTFGR